MLNIQLIRSDPDQIKKGVADKGYDAKIVDELLKVDEDRRALLQEVEALRQEQKQQSKSGPPSEEEKTKLKGLSSKISELETKLAPIEAKFNDLALRIPNLPAEGVKVGKDESENEVVRQVGDIKLKEGKDHVELGQALDIIDVERGAKVSGSRFYYIKNQAVILEFALIRWALDQLTKEGFTPLITPELVRGETLQGTGYLPVGEEEVYKTQDDLYLIGTSEQTAAGYHKDETLEKLPQRYAAFSSCFRREAGSYGKDVKGILRAHQFDKVEMFSFTEPSKSKQEHEYFLSLEEKFMQALEIPYQVVRMCTGDLGFQAADKYDIESWMPGQEKFRETHSTSNTTDFQSRRLNIKYRIPEGKTDYVHTINGTAIAIGRTLIAIIENYQQPDGSVKIPDVLVSYTGFNEIKMKH